MPRKNNAENMATFTIKAMPAQMQKVDHLVATGEFPNRNEAIRTAIREFNEKYGEGTACQAA